MAPIGQEQDNLSNKKNSNYNILKYIKYIFYMYLIQTK